MNSNHLRVVFLSPNKTKRIVTALPLIHLEELDNMQKLGTKRQITLTKAQCEAAGIKTGDDVEIRAEREGIISIVKVESESIDLKGAD